MVDTVAPPSPSTINSWGGTCTCPGGQIHQVGETGNCASLACTGGVSTFATGSSSGCYGIGSRRRSYSSHEGDHVGVTCAGTVQHLAPSQEANVTLASGMHDIVVSVSKSGGGSSGGAGTPSCSDICRQHRCGTQCPICASGGGTSDGGCNYCGANVVCRTGPVLQVSWTPEPEAPLERLSNTHLSNNVACQGETRSPAHTSCATSKLSHPLVLTFVPHSASQRTHSQSGATTTSGIWCSISAPQWTSLPTTG